MKVKEQLVNKSIEAFIMGLEIYNKPTIKYRIEGFSFFIINAWELMLKAELLNRNQSIYYDDKKERTLSVNDVISKIYTDKHQPLRLNLEKIIELRNTSTHFITEEYETIYAPFFQSNVMSFSEQIKRFHDEDITKHISQNFLTLSVNIETFDDIGLRAKYSPEMVNRIINTNKKTNEMIAQHSSADLYIPLQHNLFITKKKSEADLHVGIDNNSNDKVTIIKEVQNPNDKYKLSFNGVIKGVNKNLKSKHIEFDYLNSKGISDFNSYTLNMIMRFYNIKNDQKYSFYFAGSYRYSQQFIDFIIDEIKKDARLIEHLSKK